MIIAIVIVNWNAGERLRTCLEALARTRWPRDWQPLVVVVDNASSDDSWQRLPAALEPVLIRNARNLGFGAACNQGAHRASDADLLLFLNPDTAVEPDTVCKAVEFMTMPAQARVGILGVQMRDASGAPVPSCARFPNAGHFVAQAVGLDRVVPRLGLSMRDWDHGDTRIVDHVIGAFYLVRKREVFDPLGGFDEDFFVYLEDLDFSRRAYAKGWRACYLASTGIYHEGGGTSGQIKAARLAYALRSRLTYARKHFGAAQRALVALTTWCVEPFARAAALVAVGRVAELPTLARAYRMLARGVGRPTASTAAANAKAEAEAEAGR